jgi:hypothetical protein
MSLPELVHQLEAAGAKLRLVGDSVEVDGMDDVLTSDVENALRDHKAELVSLLAGRRESARTAGGAKAGLVPGPQEEADASRFVWFKIGGESIPIDVGFVERCCSWWAGDSRRLLLDARGYINGGRFHLTSRDELLLFLGEYCRKRAAGYDGVFLDEMMAPWLRSS